MANGRFPTSESPEIAISYGFMNRAICIMALFILPALLFAQEKAAAPQADAKSFPEPDFILRDNDLKPQKGGVVLGPMESDGKGGTKGSFAIYGGSSLVQAGSLSFSSDGRILAAGSTPGRELSPIFSAKSASPQWAPKPYLDAPFTHGEERSWDRRGWHGERGRRRLELRL